MKARLKFHSGETVEGELEVDCFFTDQWWWKFKARKFPNDQLRLTGSALLSREAALEDFKQFGVIDE